MKFLDFFRSLLPLLLFHKKTFACINEPTIEDLSNGHTIIGDNIKIKCSCIANNQKFNIEWNAPLNFHLNNRTNVTLETKTISENKYELNSIFIIMNVTLKDSSSYYCSITAEENPSAVQYKYIWIPVYKKDEHVLRITNYGISFDEGEVQIEVFIKSHPEPKITWINNNNETITNTRQFEITQEKMSLFTNYKSILSMKSVKNDDFGNYTVIANNDNLTNNSKTFKIPFNLTGAPMLDLKILEDAEYRQIKVYTVGIPKPNISCEFFKCTSLDCFFNIPEILRGNSTKLSLIPSNNNKNELVQSFFKTVSKVYMGLIKTTSSNKFDNRTELQNIYSASTSFVMLAKHSINKDNGSTVESLLKENIEIICAVSLDEYGKEIFWFKKGRKFHLKDLRAPIKAFDEYRVKNINAVYTFISILSFTISRMDQQGNYSCRATRKDGEVTTEEIQVIAKEEQVLNVASNLQNTTTVKVGNNWKFYCNIEGYPKPIIIWYKNNKTINSSEHLDIQDDNQTLVFTDLKLSDNGTYHCNVFNRYGRNELKIAMLNVEENDFDWLLFTIIGLSAVLIIVIVYVIIKLYKEKQLMRELEALGLANFEKGAIENLNPELRLDDQTEFLPYDIKWEIPTEHLELGQKLGSGAFGVVVKGNLKNFPVDGDESAVAVKMVNKFAGPECIRALASELKIMVHLGKHVNIVNLIGACTKDVVKKTLLVVVEFCTFGSLHQHITDNREQFCDQRTKDKEKFDWTIGDKKTENENKMCSQDFLLWGFQIAEGMHYLASRKVLHGDLAARNVLLSDENIVKIADFGLARNMYKDSVYKKKNKPRLPIKWMAVESIGESIFSTQSDVWAFGIVLWELFSLAKSPYPGIVVDENFYKMLVKGYRMEKPQYATTKIYNVMQDCWQANPMGRPSFKDLAEKIGTLLEESIKNYYLDMNGQYVSMNLENEDYLHMMLSPNYSKMDTAKLNGSNNLAYIASTESIVNLEHNYLNTQ